MGTVPQVNSHVLHSHTQALQMVIDLITGQLRGIMYYQTLQVHGMLNIFDDNDYIVIKVL